MPFDILHIYILYMYCSTLLYKNINNDRFLFVTAGLAIKYLVKKALQESAVGMLGNVSCFCCHLLTIFKINFLQKIFQNTSRVSNGLDLVSEILI